MSPDALPTVHPGEPWMARDDWAQRTIRGEGGGRAALAWGMATAWNVFIWTLLALIRDDPDREAMVKVAILFAFLGLVLLVAAVRTTLAWRRFGSSVLELETLPGVIGGALKGRIRTHLADPPAGPIQLTLTCLRRRIAKRRVSAGSSGTSSPTVRTDQLWQGGLLIEPEELQQGTAGLFIPVEVLIPYGLPGTSNADPDDRIIWKLGATANIPGVDFGAEFTVPVFLTPDSDPGLTEEKIDQSLDRASAFLQPAARKTCWVPPVVVQPGERGGVRYTFRLAVTLKAALGVTALALGVSAASAALFVWLGKAGPFALVPGAVGALLLLATVVIWTFVSRVVVEQGVIDVRKSVLGIPKRWRVPATDIESVRVTREGEDWHLKVERRSGPEIDIGATIPGRDDASRVARDIERALAATRERDQLS